jgi:putative ABC transport system permease protein
MGFSLAALALLLTLAGICGVLSYLITQRTKEIGIRVALGATTWTVTRLVLQQSMRLVVVGTCLGTALSIVVSRLLAAHLIFMNPYDASKYGGALILATAASIADGYLQTRRAQA